MRVDPDPGERFGAASLVNLLIEIIGDGFIMERDVCPGAGLLNQGDLIDSQQIFRIRDSESTHFGLTKITQKQQLGPSGRAEFQRGTW